MADGDGGACARCGAALPARTGGGRRRRYCGATCRSAARRARTPPAAARCSVRAGAARCPAAAAGAWYDTRGVVIARTCAGHQQLAGELAAAGLPAGRRLDRWLPRNVAWHPRQAPPPGPALLVTITLEGVHPPVWRQVQVPAALTLAAFHEVIQVAMGWSGMHLWRFGALSWHQVGEETDTSAQLAQWLRRPGDQLGYLYDFGDQWVHRIEVDKVISRPRAPMPRLAAGRRACPPEDCGGPWGYAAALKGLRARKGPGYRIARDICGPGFDPEALGKDGINRALAALASHSGRADDEHPQQQQRPAATAEELAAWNG